MYYGKLHLCNRLLGKEMTIKESISVVAAVKVGDAVTIVHLDDFTSLIYAHEAGKKVVAMLESFGTSKYTCIEKGEIG